GGAADGLIEELQIERRIRVLCRRDQLLGPGVGEGGVVLVDAVDGDVFQDGVGRLGQGGAERQGSVVAQGAPVDEAQDDRPGGAGGGGGGGAGPRSGGGG